MKGCIGTFRWRAGLALSGGMVILATLSVAHGQSDPADPNARQIVFTSERDGSGLERLTENERDDYAPDVSPDGNRVVFVSGPIGRPTRNQLFDVELNDHGFRRG